MRRASFPMLWMSIVVLMCALPAAAGTWLEEQTIAHDGLTRYYRAYVPDDSSPGMPVVFLLHGGGGDYVSLTASGPDIEWIELADEERFLLIVPNGADAETGTNTNGEDQHWNDCRTPSELATTGADDVGFMNALIDWAIATYDVDTRRVYSTGASNGGMMSYRLAFELGNRIAAIASAIANIPSPNECSVPVDIVPTMIINGDGEELYMPWDGGCILQGECNRGSVISAEETRDWWIAHNRVDDSSPTQTDFPNIFVGDNSTVSSWLYEDGVEGSTVSFYRVYNGGHNKPSIEHPYNPVVLALLGLGFQNRDVETARESWAFLTQHTLDPPPASANPGGSAYVRVEKSAGGDLDLRWSSDCGAANSFGVYRGDLTVGIDSLESVPGLCNVTALSSSLIPRLGVSEFFLVVPNDGSTEGDYGSDSAGKRSPAVTSCYPQLAVDSCAAGF